MNVPTHTAPVFERFQGVSRKSRDFRSAAFVVVCNCIATLSVVILVTLLLALALQGLRVIKPGFFVNPPSPIAAEAGIGPALAGTFWVSVLCGFVTLPLGVATGILLEEFWPRSLWGRRLHAFLQLNIANLAGVPSIVYGLLGLTAFASMFGMIGSPRQPGLEFGARYYYQYVTEGKNVVFVPVTDPLSPPDISSIDQAELANGDTVALTIVQPGESTSNAEKAFALRVNVDGGLVKRHRWYYVRLPFGRSVLAASLTLSLVILPMVIVASQQALRTVPSAQREAAVGLGLTTWQTVRHVTLPAALPEIVSGMLVSLSRAVGEAAPILMLAGIVYITQPPRHLMDEYSVLPTQIFYWATLPADRAAAINFQHVAAGGIIVLLSIILTMNGIASFVRTFARTKAGPRVR